MTGLFRCDRIHCIALCSVSKFASAMSCLEPAVSTFRKPPIPASMPRAIFSASSKAFAAKPPITIIDLSMTSCIGIRHVCVQMVRLKVLRSSPPIVGAHPARMQFSSEVHRQKFQFCQLALFPLQPSHAWTPLASLIGVAALISTLLMGSNASGTTSWGTNCVGWNFARAYASQSGVPSGAEGFVDHVMVSSPASTIFMSFFSKSPLKSCKFVEVPMAFAMVVACLYFSNLSHALEPTFFLDFRSELKLRSHHS